MITPSQACRSSALLSTVLLSLSLQLATPTRGLASEAAAYPLKTCVVTDEKLGSMGKAYVHKHEGQEVQFCCKSCLPKFNKDPQKYLKKVEDATKAQASAK
jgi:YHS domain-containing protein